MAHLIDGKQFAAKLREKMSGQIATIKSNHNVVPGLAVVLVGEDPASQVYVRSKGKQAVRYYIDRTQTRRHYHWRILAQSH